MTTWQPTRTAVDAILATLAAAGVTAYPGAPTGDTARPYLSVWPSGGMSGGGTGTLGDIYRDLVVEFQTTSVGDTVEQALWMHDKAALALAGATPTVSGRTAHPIYLDEAPQPVRRDDAPAQPLFLVTARWVFRTTA